jgi:hypothetical protein
VAIVSLMGCLRIFPMAGSKALTGGWMTLVPGTGDRGPGYFWLPSLDMSGLPLTNFALQLGTFANGHQP